MRSEQILLPVLRRTASTSVGQRVLDRLLAPINLFSRDYAENPYPAYEAVRSSGPVFRHRAMRVWMVTGYDEIEQVLRARTSVDRSGVMEVVRPWSQLGPDRLAMFTDSLLLTDPPDHTRLRRLVSRAFTPRAIARIEPRLVTLADEMVRRFRDAGGGDLVEKIFAPLPIFVIGELLGIPESDWSSLKSWSDELAKFIDMSHAFDPRTMSATIDEVRAAIDEWIEARAGRPGDDLLSELIAVEDDGERLSHDELASMVMLLMVAGHETTSGFFGNAVLALDDWPDQRRELVASPDLVHNATEELLRYDSPVQNTDRELAEDADIGGVRFAAGDFVVLLLGAANRDPRRFDRPDRLDLRRADVRPLSFGHGIHHCLGAALARAEGRAVLAAMVPVLDSLVIDRDAVEWKQSMTLRGPVKLPATC